MTPTFVLMAIPILWVLGAILAYAARRPWRKLATVYAFQGEIPAEFRSRFNFSRIGWLRYRGAITLSADRGGLYLAKSIMPWSQKLFVPWEDIAMIEKKRFLETTRKLTFRRMPEYPVELDPVVVDHLLEARDGTRSASARS